MEMAYRLKGKKGIYICQTQSIYNGSFLGPFCPSLFATRRASQASISKNRSSPPPETSLGFVQKSKHTARGTIAGPFSLQTLATGTPVKAALGSGRTSN